MTKHQHGVCVVFVLLGLLCNFALNVENNDSRLLHLPKEEFIRVMSDIIGGGDKNTPSTVEQSSEDGEFYDPMDPTGGTLSQQQSQRSSRSSYRTVMEESPRTAATKQAQTGSGLSMSDTNAALGSAQRSKRVKSDSLYFLQRSMEQREKVYREGQNLTARTDDTESSYERADGGGFLDAGFAGFT